MDEENAIEVVDVWKSFTAGAIGGKTFVNQVESIFAKLRGKSDPNSEVLLRNELTTDSSTRNSKFWALRGVSFSVKKGEVIAILGRNGAGKSTLLQVLCQITEADEGVVWKAGQIASLLGAGVGFNDEMTGRENVYLNGSILGMPPAEVKRKIEDISKFAEVEEFLDTPIKRYSSGMKARLGFSVAIHLESDIMVLDEVFATGDMVFREKCIERMKAVAESGRTILIVTHMPQLLRGVCERGLVLSQGELIFDGNIGEAISLYMHEEPSDVPTDEGSSVSPDACDDNLIIDSFELSVTDSVYDNGYHVKSLSDVEFVTSFRCLDQIEKLVLVLTFWSNKSGLLGNILLEPQISADELMTISISVRDFPLSPLVLDLECVISLYDYTNERVFLSEVRVPLVVESSEGHKHQGMCALNYNWNVK